MLIFPQLDIDLPTELTTSINVELTQINKKLTPKSSPNHELTQQSSPNNEVMQQSSPNKEVTGNNLTPEMTPGR